MNEGWICPNCTRCYAPTVLECGVCNSFKGIPMLGLPVCNCGQYTAAVCPVHGYVSFPTTSGTISLEAVITGSGG